MNAALRDMKKYKMEILFGILFLVGSFVMTFLFTRALIVYMTAEEKVTGSAAFNDDKSPRLKYGNYYDAYWNLEYEGKTYEISTRESSRPDIYNRLYVVGYIDKNGELEIVSYASFLGVLLKALAGPFVFIIAGWYILFNKKKYNKAKETYLKEKAIIDERIATQDEYM